MASRMNRFQAFLLAKALQLPGRPNETAATWAQRRMRHAGDAIRAQSAQWSIRWAKQIVNWREHVLRHTDCWAARLIQTRNAAWLRHRRREHAGASISWTERAGRTATRIVREHVQPRYEEGWIQMGLPFHGGAGQ